MLRSIPTFGDSIAIFPVTDHTLDAAPLFQARIDHEGQSLHDLAEPGVLIADRRRNLALRAGR
jgi:hypothetical protein